MAVAAYARIAEDLRGKITSHDIKPGGCRYLHDTLSAGPASATFYFLPRKPSDEESRFFGFPREGETPYVIELIRTAHAAGEDGPEPLYTVVGVYAGDRNRFEGSELALPMD